MTLSEDTLCWLGFLATLVAISTNNPRLLAQMIFASKPAAVRKSSGK